jgi:hypothetical protein
MKKVEVYWNLHKNCYSVRCDGKVIWYANSLELYGCTFKVSKAGRTRVRTEGRKNVHAFICGFLSSTQAEGLDGFEPVTYNPYANETFVLRVSGEKIEKCKVVKFFTVDGKPKVLAYIGE